MKKKRNDENSNLMPQLLSESKHITPIAKNKTPAVWMIWAVRPEKWPAPRSWHRAQQSRWPPGRPSLGPAGLEAGPWSRSGRPAGVCVGPRGPGRQQHWWKWPDREGSETGRSPDPRTSRPTARTGWRWCAEAEQRELKMRRIKIAAEWDL